MDGQQLYDLVDTYARLGIHRAGTDVDRATVDWYDAELRQLGLATQRLPVPFDRYVTDSTLTADDEPIDHLPLFYEWTGSVTTDDLHIALVDANHGGRDDDLDTVVAAGSDRAGLVLATEHPEGSLIAVNRQVRAHGGKPTVLVAARDHRRLETASSVTLSLTASTEPAETTNLIGRTPHPGPPLLLTTPLTGWFGCAGERGTGAAVLLGLVERFAHLPLLVVATGGHELDYFGVRHWVAHTPEPARAIAHIGASIAVDAPDGSNRTLISSRLAMTDQDGDTGERIGAALEPAGFVYRPGTAGWLGESEVFCDLDVPMISFTGSSVDFHTPEDTPERATSPTSLATVTAAVGDAIEALWVAT